MKTLREVVHDLIQNERAIVTRLGECLAELQAARLLAEKQEADLAELAAQLRGRVEETLKR